MPSGILTKTFLCRSTVQNQMENWEVIENGISIFQGLSKEQATSKALSITLEASKRGEDDLDLSVRPQKTADAMVTVKIESDDEDIHLACPNCDMWEQLGVDDPRHRLNVLPIIDWEKDSFGSLEHSINECLGCKTKFRVEWDYNNPMT